MTRYLMPGAGAFLAMIVLAVALVGAASAGAPTVTKEATPEDIDLYTTGQSGELTTVTITVAGSGGDTKLPLDVVFCIDSSGSMTTNDPTGLRKTAAKSFLGKMNPNIDASGVVSWDQYIDFTYPTPVTSGLTQDFATLEGRIDAINAAGRTNGNLGLTTGMSMLDNNVRTEDSAEVIIFLTDGEFNEGGSVFTQANIDRAKSSGYIVYTIGLGTNLGPYADTLKNIADQTGGKYYLATDASALQAIFDAINAAINTAPSNVDVHEMTQAYMVGEGGFSITPNTAADPSYIWNNIATSVGDGDEFLEQGEIWTVTFTVGSNKVGNLQDIQDLTGAWVYYDLEGAGVDQKVQIPQDTVNVVESVPELALEKTGTFSDTNGDGYAQPGEVIQYEFKVTNTGDVQLTGITITDSKVSNILCSGTAALAPGESTTCTGTYAVTQDDINAGSVYNLATAASDQTKEVTDDVTVTLPQNPALSIVKLTNGEDGATILVGAPVTWTYRVTNTGNVDLTNIIVTDDKFADPIGSITSLPVGASETLDQKGTAIAGAYSNTGSATSTFGDAQITTSDGSSYFGVTPKVDIEKYVKDADGVWQDADTAPGVRVDKGTNPEFKYVVTNVGDVPLSNIVVTDSVLGTIGTISGPLAPGATDETLTKTGRWSMGPQVNIGTATAWYYSEKVTDSDDANYFGWGDDSLTGLGYKESPYNKGKTFATIKKGSWFMYLTVTPTSIPDGKSLKFDIQAGTPKNGLVDVGDITITRTGTSYTITRVLDTNVVFNGYPYGLYVEDEHLAIDADKKMSFTGAPGRDDNADFDASGQYRFTDADGYFFVFAHWGAGWGPTR